MSESPQSKPIPLGESVDESFARFGAAATFAVAVTNFICQQGATISLHRLDPGLTGANEVAGGGYARKVTTWGAAALVTTPGSPDEGRAVATGSAVEIVVPAGTDVAFYGVWSAGGVFQYGKPVTPTANFPVAGTAAIVPKCSFGIV